MRNGAVGVLAGLAVVLVPAVSASAKTVTLEGKLKGQAGSHLTMKVKTSDSGKFKSFKQFKFSGVRGDPDESPPECAGLAFSGTTTKVRSNGGTFPQDYSGYANVDGYPRDPRPNTYHVGIQGSLNSLTKVKKTTGYLTLLVNIATTGTVMCYAPSVPYTLTK